MKRLKDTVRMTTTDLDRVPDYEPALLMTAPLGSRFRRRSGLSWTIGELHHRDVDNGITHAHVRWSRVVLVRAA
jgi:hypothetical protein